MERRDGRDRPVDADGRGKRRRGLRDLRELGSGWKAHCGGDEQRGGTDLGRIESEESENVERPRGESWRFGVERDAVGDWFQRYDGDDARREDSRALHEHVHVSLTRGLRVEMVAKRDAVSFGWERQLVAYL